MRADPQASLPALAAIEALQCTVAVARSLVEAGRRIDLTGFDRDTATVCTAIALLPPANARPLRPALQALLRDVEGLGTTLPAP